MTEQRIVPANASRLMRDMLKRIVHKSENLELVRAITDQKDLPSMIGRSDPGWVIVSLSYDNGVPAWVRLTWQDIPRYGLWRSPPMGVKSKSNGWKSMNRN